jgi:hypothetical protein
MCSTLRQLLGRSDRGCGPGARQGACGAYGALRPLPRDEVRSLRRAASQGRGSEAISSLLTISSRFTLKGQRTLTYPTLEMQGMHACLSRFWPRLRWVEAVADTSGRGTFYGGLEPPPLGAWLHARQVSRKTPHYRALAAARIEEMREVHFAHAAVGEVAEETALTVPPLQEGLPRRRELPYNSVRCGELPGIR